MGKLEESRTLAQAIQAAKPKYVKIDERNNSMTQSSIKRVKPPKPPAEDEEDARAVLNLEVPMFDSTRKFEGIERQKMMKKDRHMKALDDFAKTLDEVAEEIEQNVLTLSREVRERLEEIDAKIQAKYQSLTEDAYLVVKSREELDDELEYLKQTTAERSAQVEQFASDLESIECGRAENVGGRIRDLVDLLVGIAHQLPDEIEHTVESESFDLNAVVTANRNSHAELLGIMRTKQIEIDVIALHNWDVAKQQWRLLRHNQSIAIFHNDISSSEFTAPSDREHFMQRVRLNQQQRHDSRQNLINDLSNCTADTISSTEVQRIKENLTELNEDEITATLDCYNGLSTLRATLRGAAERRMEDLRKELHTYGALHPEPDLAALSNKIDAILNDADMGEVFRLGGGLRPELQSVSSELVSTDIVYDNLVSTVESRLDIISAGFNLKEVMEERGRLPRLDTIRATLSKLRTVPRAEVAGVLSALLPDLREMSGYDKMPAKFLSILNDCADGIEAEINRVQDNIDQGLGVEDRLNSRPSGSRGGSRGGAGETASQTQSRTKSKTSTKRSGTTTMGKTAGTTRNVVPEHIRLTTADPLLVKNWTRQLSLMYYVSDFCDDYKQVIVDTLLAIKEVRICNQYVDTVVLAECDKPLNHIDQRYKSLTDLIANFFEVQANALSYSSNKITDFFAKIASIMEAHKASQTTLDEASLDLLWDYSEENRFACEDREAEYEALCTKLRKSADMDELQVNFEAILKQLASILDGYRAYHGQACFLADKHPLSLIDDYAQHMDTICGIFQMQPIAPHFILDTKETLHSQNLRFNKKYLESDSATDTDTEVVNNESGADENDEKQSDKANDDEEGLDVNNKNEQDVDDGVVGGDTNSHNSSPRQNNPRNNDVATTTFADVFQIPVPVTRKIDPTHSGGGDEEVVHIDKEVRTCRYSLAEPFSDFITHFIDEAATTEEDEEDEAPVLTSVASEDKMSDDGLESVGEVKQDRVNEDYPWLVIRHYEPDADTMDMVTLVSDEAFDDMGEYDQMAYEENIAKHFVPRKEGESFDIVPDPDVVETDEDIEARKQKSVSLEEAYEKTLEIIQRTKERKLNNNNPDYLLERIPKDSTGTTFVSRIEISFSQVHSLIEGIRASVFTHLEQNCDVRIVDANQLNIKRKSELTEELEDLLRTHWPRCGLVETQIKRPREVELLNHEEKTYRFILSIQEKMANLQSLFDDTVEHTKTTCDDFRDELSSLLAVLTETQYKTLAALQGVEVKARAITQAFNASGNGLLSALRQMVAEDAMSIIIYAKDFRKICPPQGEGVSGGYSESELEDIGRLVEGQCTEIHEVLEEWKAVIQELDQAITEEACKHNNFTESFEQVANELALSQGLGQKFGAPRRRAQEKLRTEMSRDDKSAGQLDELIALLEFQCSEAVARVEAKRIDESLISTLLKGKEVSVSAKASQRDCGYEELQAVENMWALAVRVRDSLHLRAKYLQVIADESDNQPPLEIEWPSVFSRLPDPPSELKLQKLHDIVDTTCLRMIVDEVEETCKLETQDLYKGEGKEEMLAETEEGIPESLSIWLKETRHKILGPKGHHEKSWKRLWGQVDKFEVLLARKPGPLLQPQSKAGVPAACFRILGLGYELYTSVQVDQKVEQFAKLLKVWEKGKEKHERLLRPRLGSPDAQEELEQLDAIESQRTEEVRLHVEQFQSSLISFMVRFSKLFCSDLGACAKAFFLLLDSSLRLDLLQIPPDTEVPKKKVTLKRLRKAQRVKEEVQKGNEDISVERVWPCLSMDRLLVTLRDVEGLVTMTDLLKLSPPPPVVEDDEAKKKPPPKKGSVKDLTEDNDSGPPPSPPLVPEPWVQEIKDDSAVRAAVSTGHRLLVSERDASLEKLTDHVGNAIGENKLYYGKILQQEGSWSERWRAQVDMLRAGNM